jgi:hypothetical protein
MKSIRLTLTAALILITVAAMSIASTAADTQKSQSDAQKSFDKMKTLAGEWEGSVKLDPPDPDMKMDQPVHISLRVTSRGNAIVHEMQEAGTPLDPTKYDHPLTMIYLDGERLTLIHYCDAGNRPRMTAEASADSKKVEFEFRDLSGGNEHGHMYHAVFTIVDADHHFEDWTYMMPGDKPMHAHLELTRKQ